MKLLKKLASATALTFAAAASAHAGTVINNWQLNPSGTGQAGAITVEESLTVAGTSFIALNSTDGSTFSFNEYAAFNVVGKDNGLPTGTNYGLTAIFRATGTGVFSGAFTFTSGTITLYSSPTQTFGSTAGIYGADQGTAIANFTVMAGGGGLVDGSGNPTGNGVVSVFAEALTPGGLLPGYFFNSAGLDLSGTDVLSFAFTNSNGTGLPSTTAIKEIACDFGGYTGPGCSGGTYANVPGQYILGGNAGQFKLAEVPEPGSLALFGIAMLGAGVISRKRASKAA